MPRPDPPRWCLFPNSVVRTACQLAAVYLTLTLLSACSLPFGASPAARFVSPLAAEMIYWSKGNTLLALRASDGHVAWKFGDWTVTSPLPSGNGTYGFIASPSAPTLADRTLYATVSLDHAEAYALAATDGSTRWHVTFPGCLNLVGSGYPPLVADGVLYVAVSGHDCAPSGWVYALRASDGAVLWRTPFERAVLPTVALTDGALLVTSSTYPAVDEQAFLTALRASDGARLWRVSLSDSPYYLAAEDGIALISEHEQLEALRASDGTRLWITPANHYTNELPVIANGLVYVSGHDGYLYALRLQDGTIQWRFAAGTSSGVFAASVPAVVENSVYWGAGPLLYTLDSRTGALRQVYHLFPDDEGRSAANMIFDYSPPAVADGALFVAANATPICDFIDACLQQPATLYALDVATGSELWHHSEPEGTPALPPIIAP
jgi:outer membrane protein assembly factor BamB